MIKMITIVPKNKVQEFITTQRFSDYNTIPQVNRQILDVIKKYIHKTVGYESLPIGCLSKAEGSNASLEAIGSEVNNYIPISSETVLFELHMPEDMVVSIPFEELLTASNELDSCQDDWERDMYLEEFESKLKKGIIEGDNIISFIPFIDLKRCKFFAMINDNWGLNNMNIPGLKEVSLNKLGVF